MFLSQGYILFVFKMFFLKWTRSNSQACIKEKECSSLVGAIHPIPHFCPVKSGIFSKRFQSIAWPVILYQNIEKIRSIFLYLSRFLLVELQ